MAYVYSLQTQGIVWYVGSTTNTYDRKCHHLKRNDRTGSSLIPKEYELEFHILEECPVENRYVRERHYIQSLHPLYNLRVPTTKREALKRWYENHRDEYNARRRERYKLRASET